MSDKIFETNESKTTESKITELEVVDKELSEIDQLLKMIDPEYIGEFDKDALMDLRKKLNPYGRTIEGADNYLTFSYTPLSEKYNDKLRMTGMIGYLFRACDEWHVPDGIPVIPVYDYIKNPQSLQEYHKNWNFEKNPKLMVEVKDNERWMEKRVIVMEFLEEMFQFNPDEHVRSSYRPNPADGERPVVRTPAANLAIKMINKKDLEFKRQMEHFDRIANLKNMYKSWDEAKLAEGTNFKVSPEVWNRVNELVLPEHHYSTMDFSTYTDFDKNCLKTVCEIIPPTDIYHKINNYVESNYDVLREATQYLYCDKPDFEMAFNPYQWFKTREAAEEFQMKHKNEVITNIHIGESGKWNIVTPFKRVTESAKIWNEDTIVLEEIMKQQERDAKLGAELLKNSVDKKKKKNIITDGPDAEAFSKWKKQNAHIKNISAKDINSESYADEECPDDAVEVGVWKIAKGGLELEKTKFYTKAEPPLFEDESKRPL